MSFEDEVLVHLILNNAVEVAGIDSNGEFLYCFTTKIKEIMPEIYQEHMNSVSVELMSLWQKGFIDIDFLSDGSDPKISLTEKAFNEDELNALSDHDKWSIEEIKRLMRKQ